MSGMIVRVYCIDGPCQGLQYLDADTGRVLFVDIAEAPSCIYRIVQWRQHDSYPIALSRQPRVVRTLLRLLVVAFVGMLAPPAPP